MAKETACSLAESNYLAEALLESVNAVPSKFLQVYGEPRHILRKAHTKNHTEVWDIEKNMLADVHPFQQDITHGYAAYSPYMYVGDSGGNLTVLKLEQEHIVQMKHTRPYSVSHTFATLHGRRLMFFLSYMGATWFYTHLSHHMGGDLFLLAYGIRWISMDVVPST